jgi:hypothetical protein
MTREQKIVSGKLWQVYPDEKPDNILFEGSKTACRGYIRENRLQRQVKSGDVRLGQLIWEELTA